MPIMVGQTISHYEIKEKLGGGGMGVVYKAEDTRLKRTVALKFLPPELTRDTESRQRFINEARTVSSLDHPNICTVHDIGETDDGQCFIVMACYEGRTLKEKIQSTGLPVEEAVGIALQTAHGLHRAHEHGIIHRDVKPANIILTEDGIVKILDFGLAKLIGEVRITRTGSTLGTAAYMSPEQTRGDDVDQRSDIWSLGVVLYEMLTGRLPFRAEFESGVIYSILNETPPDLRSLRPDIDPGLASIVAKALQKHPEDRHQTVRELIADLAKMRTTSHQPDDIQVTTGPESSSSKRLMLWLVPLILVAASVVGYFVLRRGTSSGTDVQTSLSTPVRNSIAIFPFRDNSPGQDQDYFCNGIADELVTALSHIPELKIVSHTRAFAFREKQTDIRQAGRDLGVATVLEGSVRKMGGRVRIGVQLIDVADGFQIWGETYERGVEDILRIQEDVARAVAAALKITLAPQTAERMLPRQTNSIEAYECWLRGNYLVKLYLVSNREEDIQKALRMFEQSVRLDSTYALGYGGLAWAYEHRYVYGRYHNTTDREQVARNIRHAYALDPQSGSLNAGMGYLTSKMGDLDRAYGFLKSALKLEPRSLWVNHLVGEYLATIGLHDRAKKYFLRAIELDPYYLFAFGELADCYEFEGNFQDAEGYYRRALELSPDDRVYKFSHTRFLIKIRKGDEAEDDLNALQRSHPEYAEYKTCRALLLASRGEYRRALEIEKSAEVLSLANMRREAIDLLERNDAAKTDYLYLGLQNNPFFNNLRSDPRFQALLSRQKTLYEERSRKYGDL